ncbi:MAG: branched-chain amino acid ABC transporter permease [Actinobacteria bacterium]|nr:branched-chain amino acid ABC transporter permease [Actinomycetota bacterium]MCL5070786.1 branched-chain amino acid ABC transporter permease [Actinomycetota bacterium]
MKINYFNKINNKVYIAFVVFFILGILPIFVGKTAFIMHIMIYSLIWASVGTTWDLAFGYAGVPTLGQLGFFAIGAYTSGIITKTFAISPWVGILFGGFIAGIVGLLLGVPCLRLKGAYISLITFAFHLILPTLIHQGKAIGTGGATGLYNIPSLSIGKYIFSSGNKVPWFYVMLGMSIVIFFVIYKIINSSFGLAFTAIRDSEDFAKSLGVNIYKTKLQVFGLSAFLTGIVGAFYAHYVGIISSRILSFDTFLLIWVMMAIGGVARFPGILLGAFIITIGSELLRGFESFRLLILGAIVVIAIVLMPGGIMGLFDTVASKIHRNSNLNLKK